MPQPRKSLLERVERNTFRADRYANLLHKKWLPLDPPEWANRELWRLLRYEQGYYREPHRQAERELHAVRFSGLVRALHGGRVPEFALCSDRLERIPLSFKHNPEWVRDRHELLMRIGVPRSRRP